MSKHTPGPWKISDELTDGTHIVIDTGHPGGGCVLIETHVTGRDLADMPNARLIAAAPEMLEALKRAKAHVCRIGCTKNAYKAWHCFECDDLSAAIAKAEGKDVT